MARLRGTTDSEEGDLREDVRTRIVVAAAELLRAGGRDALTTRATAAAAGVQAPVLYRLFGDKSGLLDAVAEHGFATYLGEKAVREPGPDPVEDLRRGWDLHIGFGLAYPAVYALMYGDPRPGVPLAVATAARRILDSHIRRIAVAGRLRVDEARAAEMVHASGSGTVFALLATPEDRRDPGLSTAAREAVLSAILTESPILERPGAALAAIALRAALGDDSTVLTDGERHVLGEWLDRLAKDGAEDPPKARANGAL